MPSSKAEGLRAWGPAAAIILACVAAYAGTLGTREFIQDDQGIVGENPLLRRGLRSVPELLTTGYWEAVRGESTPVQEYRPVLMLSYLFHFLTTGPAAPPMHAGNLLLHILVCLLLWELLRRHMDESAAGAAALVYAVMPIHTEAVALLTGRSELLSGAFMMGSWLCLESNPPPKRLALGAASFCAALLTKEHSALFPLILVLADWTFEGGSPLNPKRRRVYLTLLTLDALYLWLRAVMLSSVLHGGIPYFRNAGKLVVALTFSRFAAARYLWPALTGAGQCADYSRPLIPDAYVTSPDAWACLLALAVLFGAAGYALVRKRSPWAFWILGPALFLLPTSNLIFPLDAIGAERFLYFPSIGLAVGLGHLYAKLRSQSRRSAWALGAALILWYSFASARKSLAWTSRLSYYAEAAICNPVSARTQSALGAALVEKGDVIAGRKHLLKALALEPRLSAAYYNLGRFLWERREFTEAEKILRRSLEMDPGSPDSWVLLALVLESQGRFDEERACLEKAISLWRWNYLAHYNLARMYLLAGKPAEALLHFSKFLELAPDDPEAGRVQALLLRLQREEGQKP